MPQAGGWFFNRKRGQPVRGAGCPRLFLIRDLLKDQRKHCRRLQGHQREETALGLENNAVFFPELTLWLFGPRGAGIVWGREQAWSAVRPIIPSIRNSPAEVDVALREISALA